MTHMARVSHGNNVRWALLAGGSLFLLACSSRPLARPAVAIESAYSSIAAESCRHEVDHDDPNETPYLVCPGIAGYSLIVRRVDAGRESIDIADPSQRAFPLNYQDFITRHMFSLDDKAEWRVTTKDRIRTPIALIARVHAHEEEANPDKVTRTYLALAKITPAQTCVVASIPEGTLSEDDVRRTADSAPGRQCVPPLPHMTEGREVIR
ncbi:MAG: hypothetical protein LAQ69_40860 [Acidobacteriia bacterium]|nr:hypothetical protein [Terriglobia bacterium]